jgi:hypothetical protein
MDIIDNEAIIEIVKLNLMFLIVGIGFAMIP